MACSCYNNNLRQQDKTILIAENMLSIEENKIIENIELFDIFLMVQFDFDTMFRVSNPAQKFSLKSVPRSPFPQNKSMVSGQLIYESHYGRP